MAGMRYRNSQAHAVFTSLVVLDNDLYRYPDSGRSDREIVATWLLADDFDCHTGFAHSTMARATIS
jgi:hypothetical protein